MTQPADSEIVEYGIENLEYLFETCVVNYNYSANFLLRQAQKSENNRLNFMGFAPSFGSRAIAESRDCIRDELYSLRCNQDEVQKIQALFEGNSFLAIDAVKASFLENITQADILHLATHVCINSENPELGQIFFTDGYLTPYDLATLDLNNKLTVLSACNTGTG